MFLSTKEFIIFVLIFVILFLFTKRAMLMGPDMKIINTVVIIFISLFETILLILMYKYSKNNDCQSDGFQFELSEPKHCHGWPYMQTSASPEIQNYCKQLFSTENGKNTYYSMNCSGGFVGRPVHFDYTSESNYMWENERCNPPYLNKNEPCVL